MKKLIQHHGGVIITIIVVAILICLISFTKTPLKDMQIKHITDMAGIPSNILTAPEVEIDDAGLFDESGNQIYTWDELINNGYISVSGGTVSSGANKKNMSGRLVLSKNVTSIAANAFDGCNKLTSVVTKNGLTSIGDAAFDHCTSLRSFDLSDTVSNLGEWVFANCPNLANINVSDANEAFVVVDDVLFSKDMRVLYRCIESKSGSYTFPDETTKMRNGAFENCSSLTYINTNNLINIENSGFAKCTSLKRIDIPKICSQREFRYGAFANDTALEEVNMANVTSSFAGSVFENCYNLEKILLPSNVYKLSYRTFSRCEKLTTLNLPSNMHGLDEETLKGTAIESITLPDQLTWLSARALSYMPNLKNVTYKGVTYTSASELLSVLEANGVELFEDIFIGSSFGA